MNAAARRAAALMVLLFAAASPAHADSGLPTLALFWPGLLVLLCPIIVLEGACARRVFSVGWKEALGLSTEANVSSTLVGIPLAWITALVFTAAVGVLFYATGFDPVVLPSWLGPILYPILGAAWLVEGPDWLPPLATAALCIPSYFISVWIEAQVARKLLSAEQQSHVRAWSYQANLLSYASIVLGLILLALVFWLTSL